MRTYPVQMEIAGPLAYFGDPSSGAGFQTYLIPPSSAVEGMFRAIAFLREGAYIRATRAELCSPLKLVNIVTNYRGPYRKSVLVSEGNSQQMAQVCLQDVCYRLYGEAVPTVFHLRREITDDLRELRGRRGSEVGGQSECGAG